MSRHPAHLAKREVSVYSDLLSRFRQRATATRFEGCARGDYPAFSAWVSTDGLRPVQGRLTRRPRSSPPAAFRFDRRPGASPTGGAPHRWPSSPQQGAAQRSSRRGTCRSSASSRYASLPETHELGKQHSPFLPKRTNRTGLLSDGQTAEQESSRGRDERTAHSYDDISAATNASKPAQPTDSTDRTG
jgi:hypothetical protein